MRVTVDQTTPETALHRERAPVRRLVKQPYAALPKVARHVSGSDRVNLAGEPDQDSLLLYRLRRTFRKSASFRSVLYSAILAYPDMLRRIGAVSILAIMSLVRALRAGRVAAISRRYSLRLAWR